ncbi:MAG: gluconate 2-dehydrogenase subunit 3 family protein [Opitutaceae bacterium]
MNLPGEQQNPVRMDRRAAIKWMLTAAASATLLDHPGGKAVAADTTPSAASAVLAKGYGTDPDLLRNYKPGDLWPLTFTPQQRLTASALCDVIIPADAKSPSAASLGVHDFIDEWISAPYTAHERDRAQILEGLDWIDAESQRRFKQPFVNLVVSQKREICDDICFVPNAKPEFQTAARFFTRFRDLTGGGFYTTPEGMKDIGYVGNVALAVYPGPPPEVLKQVGLA